MNHSEELRVTKVEECKIRSFKELVTLEKLARYSLGLLVIEKLLAPSPIDLSVEEVVD
ncbi:unnamed protein product [Ilex paraguariensis]|uniref:Uncharacterized protein n=1 Tax=Ilex paraguariensis TaxID=185542 RepID=A0ABC8U978_9AQUA